MEWNDENTFALIDLYEKKELLWCARHPRHYNKINRNDAWDDIADEMKISVDECKKKINGLMSGLRREKVKIKKSLGTGKGTEEIYESSWFASKRLQFLWDKDTPRKTSSSDERVDEKENEEECTEENNYEPNKISTPTAPPIPKKRLKTEDRRLDKAFELLSACATTSSNSIDDESQDFGNLVAKKLRRYDPLTRSSIQNTIMGIFLNADRGFYSSNPNSFSNSLNSNTPTSNTHTFTRAFTYPTDVSQSASSYSSNNFTAPHSTPGSIASSVDLSNQNYDLDELTYENL